MAKARDFSSEADAAFFSSYDELAVHEKMLKDDIRTRSYLTAMEGNPHLFKDKVILDIGTGTGILSMYVPALKSPCNMGHPPLNRLVN
jgi:methylase of polypeptide subunit release factors